MTERLPSPQRPNARQRDSTYQTGSAVQTNETTSEVYLHWANSDQYYVKTDEHLRNYDWKAPNGVTVRFRLKNANVEQNNVKGDRRFFIPRVSETEWDGDSTVITIPFEYRPLSGGENVTYGRTNQQEKVITDAVSAIPDRLRDNSQALAALGGEHRRDGNGPVNHLEHHLRQYVRRNNADFFIHKDLAAFLNRELDFYLKNEALNLDNLAVAGQDMAEGWFQQMRLTKAVGSKDHRLSGSDRRLPEDALGEAHIRHRDPVLHHPGEYCP